MTLAVEQQTVCEPQPFLSLPDSVRPVHVNIWRRFVQAFHYLHRAPPGCRYALGVFFEKRLMGVLVFGRPVARMEDQEQTLELTRMVLWPSPKNSESRALSLAEKWLRAKAPGVRRLIAYADTERHTGVIYRAANWTALGICGHDPNGWRSRRGRIKENGGRKAKFERLIR